MSLNKVDVFGMSAAGDDRQINKLIQRRGIELVRELAAGQVGLFQLSAEDPGNLFVRGQNGVQ